MGLRIILLFNSHHAIFIITLWIYMMLLASFATVSLGEALLQSKKETFKKKNVLSPPSIRLQDITITSNNIRTIASGINESYCSKKMKDIFCDSGNYMMSSCLSQSLLKGSKRSDLCISSSRILLHIRDKIIGNGREAISFCRKANKVVLRNSYGDIFSYENCVKYQFSTSKKKIKNKSLAYSFLKKCDDKICQFTSEIQDENCIEPSLKSRTLVFWENMICGAVSRSVAQTVIHPANTMKTILQSNRINIKSSPMKLRSLLLPSNMKMLTRGAGAQFFLSIPHGAINFAALEFVRKNLAAFADSSSWGQKAREQHNAAFGFAMDFFSSTISTICSSVVSTPQMVITDNLMAGTYGNMMEALVKVGKDKGLRGFYTGWWPGLAGKIPSYALTWTLFQQAKRAHQNIFLREPFDIENSALGCLASAMTVCVMMPVDTIKTRLVTQVNYPYLVPYKGIIDAASRIYKEESMSAFYRGLTPRLLSVVPMVGIQFGVYEYMKTIMLNKTKIANNNEKTVCSREL